MQVSTKIKLEVSDQDAATLEFMQGKCRGLYNWWVMRLRNGEYWPWPHTPSVERGVLQDDGLDVASMGLAQVG